MQPPKDEATPLVNPLLSTPASSTQSASQATMTYYNDIPAHTIQHQNRTDPGLENFVHDPNMLNAASPVDTERRARSRARNRYFPPNNTIFGAIEAIFNGDLRPATVFSSMRLMLVVLFHLILAGILAAVYTQLDVDKDDKTDFLSGTKDFADLCVTGIVFLLGGFVTTMLTRWWAFRSQCNGGLHQACVNLAMFSASLWPTGSATHRQARGLVARYCLAAKQLLFIEARAVDIHASEGAEGTLRAVRALVASGTLTAREVGVIEQLPVRSAVVISWLSAFFEKVMDKDSGLACSAFARNSDNGRYGVIYNQLFAARNAISLCHMYMQTQLPYGYIHLILCVVHLTCLANSVFCGIHLGQMIRGASTHNDGPEVLIPLMAIRITRIVFVPLLLDGMLLIGSVIAMPLGDDEDDFPAGAFLEALEDECLAPGAAIEQYHPADQMSKKDE